MLSDQVRLGQIVQLRKVHPCGTDRWVVVRLGADIGLRCLGCGRRVLLPRSIFLKRVKRWFEEAHSAAGGSQPTAELTSNPSPPPRPAKK